MEKFFIGIYRYFRNHRQIMWFSLLLSFAFFGFFAIKLHYEEDLTKILPKTEKAERSNMVFGQLSVKDKIFVEFVSASDSTDQTVLSEVCDEFVSRLEARDSSAALIDNILYRFQDEWAMNAFDYALSSFPSMIDSTAYATFDECLSVESLEARMAENVEIMNNDWDGNATMMVSYDPFGLRYALMDKLSSVTSSEGSYKIIDRHLFSPDGNVCLAFISQDFKSFDSMSGAHLVKMIRETAKELKKDFPDVDVLYHGATVNAADNSRTIKQDLVITISISLLIILSLLMLCFRNRSSLMAIVFPIVYGTLFAMSMVYWIKGSMSLMAMGLAVIVLGISLSYVLHVLTHFKYVNDSERVIREQAKPVCLGCITTVGAFAGLLFTTSELLSDFGIFASLVLLGTTFCSLVFLPQFFNPENNLRNERAFAFLEKINSAEPDRRIPLLVLIALVSVVCFIFAPKVKFDSNLKHIGYESPVNKASQKVYGEKVNGGYTSTFIAVSDTTLNDAVIRNSQMKPVLDSLRSAGIVASYSKMNSVLIDRESQLANIERWKNYWSEDRKQMAKRNLSHVAAEYGLTSDIFEPFFSLIDSDYSPCSLVEDGVIPAELAGNIVEKVDSSYLVFTSVLTDASNKKEMCDVVSENHNAFIVDPFYYTSDMIEIVNDDFKTVLLISSVFVLAVLLLSFRNIVISLIAFVPMCASWFITEGVMAMTGLEFNLINILISSLVFGVGVDYSIFIMDGLLATRRGENTSLLTYHKTAISLSAFILCVVVASLLISRHPALVSVGLTTLIGMVSTMLFAYCVEPFLFRMLLKFNVLKIK